MCERGEGVKRVVYVANRGSVWRSRSHGGVGLRRRELDVTEPGGQGQEARAGCAVPASLPPPFIHPPVHLSVHLLIIRHPPIHLSMHPSTRSLTHLPVHPPVPPSLPNQVPHGLLGISAAAGVSDAKVPCGSRVASLWRLWGGEEGVG